ncbi:MAG: Nif3-like dinuclear metal center hexameric protein [SAR324 cluster bacterium]|uniref:Nif3-like dinuclear metal center hexameric protein n=1 Tax=SAR324 cluster bacterium TaxID=2024889 RepID=A0A7X9FTX1_9DELT|nr:Nif3-like dinuclear metal center hexameric protein [SAR324 cluster bacterium]
MFRDKIIHFCEEYLRTKNFNDYCHNGLQVEGKSEVQRIVGGVSISTRLIEEALRLKAQMLIVHHGFFGNSIPQPPVIRGVTKLRLKTILENDLNLCGFHLPLDAHPQIGNNASLCRLLGLKNLKPYDVGFIGELNRALKRDDFLRKVNMLLKTQSMILDYGPKMIRKVCVISGGASPSYEGAFVAGADTLLCGDIQEYVVRGVEECGMNLINAGHYNTEKLGVENLLKLLSKKFKIETHFVDIPCNV